ncbi:MAG TPA: PAC2 family protein [Dehalococcoidia bacterium]|nr:PAC2 family protein [Dehalococcoidia bacterium]
MTQVGPFELIDVPPLGEPRMLVALQPWVDVGSVGTMVLTFLEETFGGQPIGELTRPGRFYDFTRYRPTMYRREGKREVSVPNTRLHHARDKEDRDWLLLHALEPHANGDEYTAGVIDLCTHFDVREYVLIGSMYAPVPHTRPPAASGGATDDDLTAKLRAAGIRESTYEGPTTILATASVAAEKLGVRTAGIILQLPAYAQIERDYTGLYGLLSLLDNVYGFGFKLDQLREQSERQMDAINESVADDSRLKAWLAELEQAYDAERGGEPAGDDTPLSPELESFLRDIEKRMD